MEQFSSLSLDNNENSYRRKNEAKDPFNVQSMLRSIDDNGDRKRSDFNVQSMRLALLDDLSNSVHDKDVDMEDISSRPSIAATGSKPPITNFNAHLDDPYSMDVEMEDASIIMEHNDEPSGTPIKNLLRATKETLLSPTNMGAELALGMSSPKKSTTRSKLPPSTQSIGTSPLASPTLRPSTSSTLTLRNTPTISSSTGTTSVGSSAALSASAPISNTHYHQHHYSVKLPSPWNAPTEIALDTTVQTNNRLYAISSYLQILSNLVFASFVAYCLFGVVQIFAADVNAKRAQYISRAVAESQRCAREYVRNECRLDIRRPLLEEQCNRWEACMDADPDQAVGTLKLYAEVAAETINSFIEAFAARSLIVGITMVAMALATFYFSNFAFGYWRAKLYYKNKPVDAHSLKLN